MPGSWQCTNNRQFSYCFTVVWASDSLSVLANHQAGAVSSPGLQKAYKPRFVYFFGKM